MNVTARRLPAALLLLMSVLSLVSPLFGSSADATLPACCKRIGKHHCAEPAGSASNTADPAPTLRGEGRCPLYPASAAATLYAVADAPRASHTAILIADLAAHDSYQLLSYSPRTDRAHAKRGPPSSRPQA